MIKYGHLGCVTLDLIISIETWELFLMATYLTLIWDLQRRVNTDLCKDVDVVPPFTNVLIAFWALLCNIGEEKQYEILTW